MRDRFSSAWIAVAVVAALGACSGGDDDSGEGGSGNGDGSGGKAMSGTGGTASGSGGSGSAGMTGSGGMMGSGGAMSSGSGGMMACGSTGSGGSPASMGGSGGMPMRGGGLGPDWQNFCDPRMATLGTKERGQYLVDHVLNCGVCHTPSNKDGTQNMDMYLAGSRSYDFTDVDGTIITVNAENLTNHNPEGLFTWTDGQVRTAVTKGVDDEHYAIYPIMPYPEYSMLTDEDIDSIIKYLRTVPANDNVVAADFPHADINPPAPLVDETKVPHTTLDKADPDYAAAERGRYLAMTGCLNCHTEEVQHDMKIMPDVPNLDKAFAGGKIYTFIRGAAPNTSTNLTPDATGLKDWTVDDIVTALKTNKEKGTGREFCKTHPGGADRIGGITDEDLTDIATYIHTLPAVKNGPFMCEAASQ